MVPISPESAWKATLGELELQMPKATFNTWLKDTKVLSCEGSTYVLGVRNDYARDWLENRLQDTILRTLSAIVAEPVDLRFTVCSNGSAAHAAVTNGATHMTAINHNVVTSSTTPAAANGSVGTNGRAPAPIENGDPSSYISGNASLYNRYTFSTFVVGHSNRLAHAAALSVAENPGQTYNPLFIYGGVGLGKTHLLHAIGHRCEGSGLKVCYITSETFTNDLIQSIRAQKMAEFRERYRSPDVLLIDDIQFIAGKESTQEEFFHTFNDLHSLGKQVILSSDRSPKAMSTLEERLQSRFEWGLMTDIQLPDVETRRAILLNKAEEANVHLPAHVVDTISHHIRNNIRELEGALNKVIAYARLTGSPIDDQLVGMAMADLMHTPEKVTVEQVVKATAKYYRVSVEAMKSSSRTRTIAFPRQVAMYLSRTETDTSFPQIGLMMGNRDHTTILYGYEKIAAKIDSDSGVRRDVLEIKAALYASAN